MALLIDVARTLVARADDMGLPVWVRIRSGMGKGFRLGLRNASRDQVKGTYELPVQLELARFLRWGDSFLDIGGNIGFFSMIAARLVGQSGRVFAVEPVPENAHCIRANARMNRLDNIHVLEVAVGPTEGQCDLMLARHPGGASLAHAEVTRDPEGRLRVRATTVDKLLETGRISPPDLIKIDVEGTEVDVLEGMRRTLCTQRSTIIFEVDAATEQAAEVKYARVSDWLCKLDYSVQRLEPGYPENSWAVLHGVAAPAEEARL
jgi:FkbM family methyltransferase